MCKKLISIIVLTPLLAGLVYGQVIPTRTTSLEAYDMPGYFLVCRDTTRSVRLVQAGSETPQGLWNFVPGLAGTGTVSFMPTALSNHYMRHRNYILYADPAATDALFMGDASFTPRPGLADPTCVSFESQNFPGRYLIHGTPGTTIGFRIDPVSTDDQRARATFRFSTYSPQAATKPYPADEATDVPQDAILSWTPGQYAAAHDVYLGASFDDVNTATRGAPAGVLASQGQTAADFDPAGLLDFGQTYYWRVDEVNDPSAGGTIFKGKVWSLTAEPYSYPVTPMLATASSSYNDDTEPNKTINGSGLNASDQHSDVITDMWVSSKTGPQPTWIQYEFDRVCKLDQMWVWNSNQAIEEILGFGARQVQVEVSTDANTWTAIPNVPEFAQATGLDDYVYNTVVDLGGAVAKYVKLTCLSTWGGGTQCSLSEVRFFSGPTQARGPEPANAATGVDVGTTLNWRPGRDAVRHEVYLGTDPNALVLATTVTDHRVALASLGAEYGQTYYWRVNEVNDAATPASWEGDLWSLSTSVYKVVDNFESYNDQCNRVYYAWKGGAGNSENPDCGVSAYSGNGTGSAVGNNNPPYADRTHVHSGSQAMPLFYDNTSGSGVSEAVLTLSPAQDWTVGGIQTLVLFFQGDLANGAGQVYVKINGTKVSYNGNAAALTTGLWNQWNVDLSGLSVQAVSSLTIGVSGTGQGVLYVDDIRLYRQAPAVAVPTDPGTGALAAYYAFEGDAKDAAGKGYNGTLMNEPTFGDSKAGLGKALALDGVNDYVELPIGSLVSTLTSTTVSAWINLDTASTGSYVRVFDFGTSSTAGYMFLCPRQGTTGTMRFAITTGTNTGESGVNAPRALTAGWHHVAVVIDGVAMTLQLVLDGEVVATGTTNTVPSNLGATTQNWLGHSQWSGDGYYQGQIDEFRIYNRALTIGEVRYLAGDR
ncbi:MAG: AbfB domain-containing protein [Phycisphaerae bacterium]|nr:AbfB domain-containing protein [Phycisphaerae bacterium]